MEATGSNFKPFLKLYRNNIVSRGRYIHISKLEDCKRWRIVILCKLGNSCTTENRFARINSTMESGVSGESFMQKSYLLELTRSSSISVESGVNIPEVIVIINNRYSEFYAGLCC